ncbi:MAG: efflux RND transporter periplasmic adaptor subunit [Armatimonadota bacterium]|nr:efflux RND transporter periplasmic adaptor subunit [Armatimonadota bacterium]MDR7452416.1 efflux RND transporter periplasmic adaptor subunit [Armatimonadota bacterium]MDR7468093.1 efflux RND transporter periplasmic adaptor subunit [Armatimonadota bacterium]MDR7494663.1 efflux RND transporter periplasmic adaptor subunit [Armatimonadota bacterium]MDR7500204.1 efflux RND transporter periplasmic adaptor subunit [Armatimonadota bacterium]
MPVGTVISRRTAAVLILILLGGIALAWVFLGSGGPMEVEAARITRGALEVALPVEGIFETRAVELAFEIPGRLAAVSVAEGDAVFAGQRLAWLETAELAAAVEQAAAAAQAARSEVARAGAAVEAARQQAVQAQAAYGAALANLRQLRAGARVEELRQAEAAAAAAASALEQARRNLATTEQLFSQGAVAQSQVDAARAQYQTAEAQYRQAAAQLQAVRAGARPEAVEAAEQQAAQARAAAQAARVNIGQAEAVLQAARANALQTEATLRAARARMARAYLTAPFDGVVSRIFLTAGSPVGPGVPVITLVSREGWVTAEVDESDIDEVRLGQQARITADAYPGLTLTGRVTRIGSAVEIRGGTRIVRVRVDPDRPSGMRAGTSVDVSIIRSRLPGVLLVPIDAVQPGEDGLHYVFVVEAGLLRRRQIRLGERNEVAAEVVAGLREGDLVALGDPAALQEGMRVRVRLAP